MCSGTGWVLGYPRRAHPRTPAPPCTAMATPRCTWRRTTAIAESSDRSSMPKPKSTPGTATGGAPFALAANRPLSAPRRVPAAVGRAGTRRCTVPRTEAILHVSRSCCCAAPTGPSRTTTGTVTGTVTLRCAAQPKPKTATAARVQADAEATRGTGWEARAIRGGREPGALRPSPHSPAIPPASRPIPPRAACAVGVCRRRSPIQRGGRQQPTQHTHWNERPRRAPSRAPFAPTGRSVEHIARERLLPWRHKARKPTQCCAAHSEGGQACLTECELASPQTVGIGVAG